MIGLGIVLGTIVFSAVAVALGAAKRERTSVFSRSFWTG